MYAGPAAQVGLRSGRCPPASPALAAYIDHRASSSADVTASRRPRPWTEPRPDQRGEINVPASGQGMVGKVKDALT
jgi:hypothetical protein